MCVLVLRLRDGRRADGVEEKHDVLVGGDDGGDVVEVRGAFRVEDVVDGDLDVVGDLADGVELRLDAVGAGPLGLLLRMLEELG